MNVFGCRNWKKKKKKKWSKINILRSSQKILGDSSILVLTGIAQYIVFVYGTVLQFKTKATFNRGTYQETEVCWERLECSHKYCAEALEDPTVTGSIFKDPFFARMLLCICINLRIASLKSCHSMRFQQKQTKILKRVSSSLVKMENCLPGTIYGIIRLSTDSSLNFSFFIMSFVRTGH